MRTITECRVGGCGQQVVGTSEFEIPLVLFGEAISVGVIIPTCAACRTLIRDAAEAGQMAVAS